MKQRTVAKRVTTSGTGVFSGCKAQISLVPAPAGHGIVFQRTDLPDKPLIPAVVGAVYATPRCTVLGTGNNVQVQTVEHLMAALRAFEIDHLLVEISGPEVPIFDGSAQAFIQLIESAGIQELDEEKEWLVCEKPVALSLGQAHLVALPADEYKVSYTLHYPHCKRIGSQFYSFTLTAEGFKEQIASCRTFSVYEEIAPMIEKGLIKGGSLDSAVLVKNGEVANSEGLRFDDEMVRHKVLDLIGDLALIPPFKAHIIAICSGHTSNHAFGKQFLESLKRVECV